MTGFVEDVRPFLASAQLYVCPIWDGGGTRLKILDAMAMGVAVVSTSVGCEGIDVSPEENILIADRPEEFVDQIKRVLRDEELRVRLGRAARDLVVRKYAWERIGSKMCEAYECLV